MRIPQLLNFICDIRFGRRSLSLSRMVLIAVIIVLLIHPAYMTTHWVAVVLALLGYCFAAKRSCEHGLRDGACAIEKRESNDSNPDSN